MEHAGRAALALRGTLPATHKGLTKALKNRLVRSGVLSEDLWDKIDGARLRRFEVEYDTPRRARRRRDTSTARPQSRSQKRCENTCC